MNKICPTTEMILISGNQDREVIGPAVAILRNMNWPETEFGRMIIVL